MRKSIQSRAGVLAASVATVVATIGVAGCGGGDDAGGGGVGAAAIDDSGGNGSLATITPTENATTTTEALAELPPPDIPDEASPPTTGPETEPLEIPEGPLFGEFLVDVEPEGHVDVPVSLRQGQEITILSNADDGIYTHISVYGPDGTVLDDWDGGQPEVINGVYYDESDPLPTDGVYVIRVQHRSGRDDPFMLRFYGEA
jgi:hypothetical protein